MSDWIIEGAEAFITGSGYSTRVDRHVIERVTPTLVILDNGSRFRRKTLTRKVTDWFSETLRSADDPYVLSQVKRNREENAVNAIFFAAERFKSVGGGEDHLQAIEEKIAEYRALMHPKPAQPGTDPSRAVRQLRECVVCGEQVPGSHATEAWEKRHEHTDLTGSKP